MIGTRLKLTELCEKHKITPTNLAKQIGVSYVSLYRYNKDARSIRQTTVRELAKYFKLNAEELFEKKHTP